MKSCLGILCCGVLIAIARPGTGHAAPASENDHNAQDWRARLIPLPHEIAISGQTTLSTAELGLWINPAAGEIEKQAGAELMELLGIKAGELVHNPLYEIVLGVLDAPGAIRGMPVPEAARLQTLPNSGQAYCIRPLPGPALAVTSWNAKGVYYGVQTLKQLLAPRVCNGNVTVPTVLVVDWPDFAERGTWNVKAPDYTSAWMSSFKLNLTKFSGGWEPAQRGQPLVYKINLESLDALRRRAFVLPVQITHLNFLDRPENARLFTAYPELAGQGETAWQTHNPSRRHRVPCASNPLLKQLLRQLFEDLGRKGVRDISVWQSEYASQCTCGQCVRSGKRQIQLETDVLLAAWNAVREIFPDLNLRIFFSLADASPATAACLQQLPPQVIIEYVYGGQALFDECARAGRRVIHWHLHTYLSYALRPLHEQILDLRQKGWAGACGFNGIKFNNAALAEWTWNARGRTEREFALAWACNQGYDHPEAFADWVELIGPANEIHRKFSGPAHKALQALADRQKPGPPGGGGAFANETLAARARAALDCARLIQRDDLIIESQRAVAFFNLLQAAAELNGHPDRPREELLDNLRQAVADNIKATDGKTKYGLDWLTRVEQNLAGK